MKRKLAITISLILIIISFIGSLILYPSLPENIDSHWDAAGNVNGTMPRLQGMFMVPALTLVIFLLLIFLPMIDPLKEKAKNLDRVYGSFILAFTIFMAYIHALVVAWNLGYRLNMSKSIIPAIAILFYYIGIILRHCKRNWFIGIRTPWTMDSDEVWDETHRVAAILFKILGIVIFIGIFLPNIILVFVPVLLVIIFLIFYSYFLYARKQKKIFKKDLKKKRKSLIEEKKALRKKHIDEKRHHETRH